MKMISVLVTCYNEEKSIESLYLEITKVFTQELKEYDYEIIFCDNASDDDTESIISMICDKDKKCKAVFNSSNFGFHRNIFNAFTYSSGDAAFLIFGDMQDPPELIPEFIRKWEGGADIVVGQRGKTQEKGVKKFFRALFYDVVDILGQKKFIHDMNGFGLYDKNFVDTITRIDEVSPYFKAVVDEYGGKIDIVSYEQKRSARGKSNFNFWANYDFSMYGITTSTKMLMRIATFIGAFIAICGFVLAIYVVIRKLLMWDSYPIGSASIMVAILVIGGIQLLFVGVLGEYILTINERISRKPRCGIRKKINF